MKSVCDLVSIIVPIYNSEFSLKQCLESILNQTYINFELLLINDGSTDNSGQICNTYAKKDVRIRVFHQENAGVSVARNIGLDNAKGNYILFIDSDDKVDENYIESFQINEIKQNNKVLIIQELYKQFNEDISKLFSLPNLNIEINNYSELFSKYNLFQYGYSAGKIFNNGLIQKYNIRFHKEISYTEDLIFMLEYIVYTESIILQSKCGYYYIDNLSSKSLSRSYFPFESEMSNFNLFKSITDKYDFKGESLDNTNEQLAIRLFRIIYSLYRPSFRKNHSERLSILKSLATKENKLYLNRINCKNKLIINNLSLFFFAPKKVRVLDMIFSILFGVRYITEKVLDTLRIQ